MDYSSFAIWISYASYAAVVPGLFGVIAAKVKKPVTAVLFVFVSIAAAGMCGWSSQLAMRYKVSNRDEICEISNDGNEIMNQWQVLINKYMCTTDCYCYQGANGIIRRKWEDAGEDWFVKFNRTTKSQMYFTGDDN